MAHSSIRFLNSLSNVFTRRNLRTTKQSFCKSVLVDKYSDITLISLNRPHKRNCLNIESISQLKEALLAFDNDNSASIAVLYGEGGNFCSGFDIDEVIEKGYEPILKECKYIKEGPLCKKPLIAAVDGFAVAEGLELALACDLRVIEQTAVLGFFGKRYGAPTLLGGAQRLTDLVGASRAINFLCSGVQISGEVANEWGLAARCVSTGTAIGQATNLAMSIAKYPQNSLIFDKLEVYKYLQRRKLNEADKDIEVYKAGAIQDIEKNITRFKEGIGKHGKFSYIKLPEVPDWEKEEDLLEKA